MIRPAACLQACQNWKHTAFGDGKQWGRPTSLHSSRLEEGYAAITRTHAHPTRNELCQSNTFLTEFPVMGDRMEGRSPHALKCYHS